ncbi:MAG TPA: redoxin domain-containing protein [Candidatus Hydrogenedentes bacterium]|nr:redoxin domain-containing protein [Candidatus Hydrogenedentota bacterium]HOV74212.1 redoxin domain-containing protein [Candidatus Hydrogenedentota bacterium]HPC15754.1 redoxin domain-containing protein [Candidatus Hydrogenedentota bacterium]HRT19622.1 redoxin domain-containing protein [Candidatus Hydrogenedentota bacterium]HRT64397.1 redoxin domain-containing protein [Candidatus Hydrogenedentota bacterium]
MMKPGWMFLVIAALIVFGASLDQKSHAQAFEQPGALATLDLPMPELAGAPADWINTGGRRFVFEPGRVHVVHFWTYGCINCKRNLPAYGQWQRKYAKAPLTVVGVHTPESEKEKDPKNVAQETRKLGITYPVLMDIHAVNWKRWEQQVWPTVYLVDKRGHVRAYWVGELEWQGAGGTRIMERLIEELLREPFSPTPDGDTNSFGY